MMGTPYNTNRMLTAYLQAAMRSASYEKLEDGMFYGEIPGFDGVLAYAETTEGCSSELEQVLEDWILLGVSLQHELPEVDGLSLRVKRPA